MGIGIDGMEVWMEWRNGVTDGRIDDMNDGLKIDRDGN